MYKDKAVCVVIPAFNEALQIRSVIDSIPAYVDAIVVVDDASTDGTSKAVAQEQKQNSRLFLLRHELNQGCGGALVTGYYWAQENEYDIIVRMDGDGQMNPEDLEPLIKPVAQEQCDYAKGNRFFSGKAYNTMPKVRFFGTAFLSLLTKIVSGYWHLSDFQSGFTAINKKALKIIDWSKMYKRYGQPNDQLILLNIENFVVKDIPVDPIYNVGEKSGINIKKIIFTLSWLLFKRFFWRLKEKYIIRDFHPLIFFYSLGMLLGVISIILFARVFYIWIFYSHIPSINALAAFASFLASAQFSLFAMWFDMEANKHLKGKDL